VLTLAPVVLCGRVDNEFFPLERETTFVYEGTKDGAPTRNEVHVNDKTIRIRNVGATVVRDRAFEDNVLVEDSLDYYAQDASLTGTPQGNVEVRARAGAREHRQRGG